MARRIVVTGRRGAGKSPFAAPISRYLRHSTLLVDLDPDLSLAGILDFNISNEGYKPQK